MDVDPGGVNVEKEVAGDSASPLLPVSIPYWLLIHTQEVRNLSAEDTLVPGSTRMFPSEDRLILYQDRSRGAGPDSTSP